MLYCFILNNKTVEDLIVNLFRSKILYLNSLIKRESKLILVYII